MISNTNLNSARIDERIPVQFMVGHQHLYGMLHLPLNSKNVPAVLICHGLGGDKNGKFRTYVTLASMLAQHGIASLRFDYRGCGDSEGEFGDVTIESQIQDALAAAQWLKKYPMIDPTRMGIFGRSFGGLIATHTAFKTEFFKSIALWAAVYNGHSWQHIWDEIMQGTATPENYVDVMNINGQMSGMTLWQQLFQVDTDVAVKNLVQIPMLNIHGIKDPRVVVSHAGKYAESRENATALSRFVTLPEGDHDFSNNWEREEALDITIDWFRQTL